MIVTVMNSNYNQLAGNYLFAEMNRRISEYKRANPAARVIRLGIGDVTLPLAPAVVAAMEKAVREMGEADTFRGYGPEPGYEFLRAAIAEHAYRRRGLEVSPDEIFVSDGSKSDVANFQELFSPDAVVAIPDPVYPVYRDSNLMAGRGARLLHLPCRADNGFIPEPPAEHTDVVYLCSPNNPTGAAMNREQLRAFVEYALREHAVILFDAAYEAYIRTPSLPHSIFEIPGAERVAVEFRSFSKTAGFTGVRCAYVAAPKTVEVRDDNGALHKLNDLWFRRQSTKFNGVSYIVQRGAEAVFSPEGARQVVAQTDYYMTNAEIIRTGLNAAGWETFGGWDSPYIWLKLKPGVKSFDFFGQLLERANVVGTPGVGFGDCGEGYFRLTAFGDRDLTFEAIERIKKRM